MRFTSFCTERSYTTSGGGRLENLDDSGSQSSDRVSRDSRSSSVGDDYSWIGVTSHNSDGACISTSFSGEDESE